MAFMTHREIKVLAAELYKHNITGLQLVGSDAWLTDHSLTDIEGHSILVGSIGFIVSRAQIPGLGKHLRDFQPSQFPDIYAVAHALNNLFECKDGMGPFSNGDCANIDHIEPWQVMSPGSRLSLALSQHEHETEMWHALSNRLYNKVTIEGTKKLAFTFQSKEHVQVDSAFPFCVTLRCFTLLENPSPEAWIGPEHQQVRGMRP
ncbi:unnamed protein product [Arctogadus glacialis]